jgi:pSer/pThr/pTyr-binding forkhead associated (FHA) protein
VVKRHWLTVIENGEAAFRFQMQGIYIIGRLQGRCQKTAIAFEETPTLIIINKARHLSGVHCVLFQDEIGYQLIDGWGQYFSTNGVFCNGRRVQFAALKHGDLIIVGSDEVSLLYESERFDVGEDEKETLSKVL